MRSSRERKPPAAFYTVRPKDVGEAVVRCFARRWVVFGQFGRLLDQNDVGKRIHREGVMLVLETDQQRARRWGLPVDWSPHGGRSPLIWREARIDDNPVALSAIDPKGFFGTIGGRHGARAAVFVSTPEAAAEFDRAGHEA